MQPDVQHCGPHQDSDYLGGRVLHVWRHDALEEIDRHLHRLAGHSVVHTPHCSGMSVSLAERPRLWEEIAVS